MQRQRCNQLMRPVALIHYSIRARRPPSEIWNSPLSPQKRTGPPQLTPSMSGESEVFNWRYTEHRGASASIRFRRSTMDRFRRTHQSEPLVQTVRAEKAEETSRRFDTPRPQAASVADDQSSSRERVVCGAIVLRHAGRRHRAN